MLKRRSFFAALLGASVSIPASAAAPLSSDSIEKAWSDTEGVTVGLCNGKNSIFTLSWNPDPQRTHVYLNGLHQRAGGDYDLAGRVITFVHPPSSGDTVDVDAEGRFNV